MATVVRLTNRENQTVVLRIDQVVWMLDMREKRPHQRVVVWDAPDERSEELHLRRTVVMGALDAVHRLMVDQEH